jgi:hypothetical protein
MKQKSGKSQEWDIQQNAQPVFLKLAKLRHLHRQGEMVVKCKVATRMESWDR